jgi:hypothetical protein
MTTTINKRVRIVRKEKDGITLDFKGDLGLKKAPWEEFNKMYEFCPDNNLYCILKPDWQEKMKEAGELLDAALIHYLQIDWKIANPDPNVVPDLVQVGTVGLYVEKISKLLECSYLDAYRLLNDQAIAVRAALGEPGSFRGLGADKIQKQQNPQPKPKQQISTNRIGDINPNLEKLKQQLERNEQGNK